MIHDHVWEMRHLILTIRDEWAPGWDHTGLLSWIDQRPALVEFLRDVGKPEARQSLPGGDDTLMALYAISRLVDIAIAPHQPVNNDPDLLSWRTKKPWWEGPLPGRTVWPQLCRALGATPIAEDGFHPFFHEIVAVEESEDPDERPRLVAEHWGGAIVGSMLLQRCGVTIRAGRNRVDPEVAARSCLYFSWYRRNRAVYDMSHGWGHNSQWKTDFRRDYLTADDLHYNVDGSSEERAANIDLLRYRHRLLPEPGKDPWHFNDRHVEAR